MPAPSSLIGFPRWAVGRHVTAMKLTPCTLSGDITLGYTFAPITASAEQIYGHLNKVSIKQRTTVENISSMDRVMANNVLIENDHSVSITEIEKQLGDNLLAKCFNNPTYLYWKYELTRGVQTWTGFVMFGDYSMDATKSGILGEVELIQVDPGGNTGSPGYN